MDKLTLKQKILLFILIAGSVLIWIFQRGLYAEPTKKETTPTPTAQVQEASGKPEVVSTKPTDLENSYILPTQVIEITFNMPFENIGEAKNRVEPKADYKAELSVDRKTLILKPARTWDLGKSYTLIIQPDSKFDGRKLLNRDVNFHFRTINYNGV